MQEFLPNTCQNKCIYQYSINPKYNKQRIIDLVKTYILLGTFGYNCTRGQSNNEGGKQLHENRNR